MAGIFPKWAEDAARRDIEASKRFRKRAAQQELLVLVALFALGVVLLLVVRGFQP